MTVAQDMASARYAEIQTKLADPGLPVDEQLRLKLELFPMVVIMGSEYDLSWWVPGKMCPLESLCDWIEEQVYLEQRPDDD